MPFQLWIRNGGGPGIRPFVGDCFSFGIVPADGSALEKLSLVSKLILMGGDAELGLPLHWREFRNPAGFSKVPLSALRIVLHAQKLSILQVGKEETKLQVPPFTLAEHREGLLLVKPVPAACVDSPLLMVREYREVTFCFEEVKDEVSSIRGRVVLSEEMFPTFALK